MSNQTQKLSTSVIRKMIASAVTNCKYLSFDPADLKTAQNPLSWKRDAKKRMAKAMEDFDVSSVQDFVESSDDTQFLSSNAGRQITEKSIVRYFVVPDLTLDCIVISDELDQNVLAYMWHQD